MTKEVFQLEVQVNTKPALTGLQSFNKELDSSKKKVDDLSKTKLDGLKTQVSGLSTAFKGLSGIIAGISFATIIKQTVQTIAAFETIKVTLQTITGSAKGAADAFALIQSVSAQTGFSVQQLSESFINLQSNGIEPTAERLKLFADVASATGNKVQAFNAITNLFARNMQGGLGLEDLNILANAGIPVFDILAKKVGLARTQIAEVGRTAEGAQKILSVLSRELGTRFGGQSAKQLETINGQFALLAANAEAAAIAIGDTGLSGSIVNLLKTLNETAQISKETSSTIGGFFTNVVDGLDVGLKSLTYVFEKLGVAIKFVWDNIEWFLLAAAAIAVVLVGPEAAIAGIIALFVDFGATLNAFRIGFAALIRNFGTLTAGMTRLRAVWVTITEVFSTFVKVLSETRIGSAIISTFQTIDKVLVGIFGKWIARISEIIAGLAVIGKIKNLFSSDSASATPKYDFPNTAGAGRGKAGGASEGETKKYFADQASERLTTLKNIIAALNQETSIIGLNAREAEKQNKIYELQKSIRDKLTAANKSEEEIQKAIQLSAGEASAIRGAVDAKYSAARKLAMTEEFNAVTSQLTLMNLTGQELERQTYLHEKITELEKQGPVTEANRLTLLSNINDILSTKQTIYMRELSKETKYQVSLLGLSSNELEKQSFLHQKLLDIGKLETASEKEKADILAEITKLQDARITTSLAKNLEGIQKETEYLKLGNLEREKRNALDQAASDAGFKNTAEFQKARPVEAAAISNATATRVQTGIDVEGQKTIDDLKEQVSLNSILNDKERERVKTRLDLYKAIDPEGKGKNISTAQKNEIEALEKTIEAQNKLLEINKKISDSFTTLGSAVTKWKLGATGGIEQVRLELIKLIALQAFKTFAGGSSDGLVGSFINGVIGGLSGARAEGGPVEAGKSYLVGEKRPEVFTPTQNGYIIPNTSMVNSSSGQVSSVSISPNLIIHGSVTGQSELDAAFEQFATEMATQTQKYVIQQVGQGGIIRGK